MHPSLLSSVHRGLEVELELSMTMIQLVLMTWHFLLYLRWMGHLHALEAAISTMPTHARVVDVDAIIED